MKRTTKKVVLQLVNKNSGRFGSIMILDKDSVGSMHKLENEEVNKVY